jgi:hypothetical protein
MTASNSGTALIATAHALYAINLEKGNHIKKRLDGLDQPVVTLQVRTELVGTDVGRITLAEFTELFCRTLLYFDNHE